MDLALGSNRVPVRGPTEGMFLVGLWDLMLCLYDSSRMNRAQTRNRPSHQGIWSPRRRSYSILSDSTLMELFAVCKVELPPHVLARLWAPLSDPATGQLRDNLHSRLKVALDNRKIGPGSAEHFYGALIGRSLLDTSVRHMSLPGLVLEMVSDDWLLVRDPQGRIHWPYGPALVTGDGTPFFYWRGTHVPSYFIPVTEEWRERYPDYEISTLTRPYRAMTAEQALRVRNTEQRRAACEIVGWHKILEDLHAVVIDRDPDPTIGELLLVRIPADFQEVDQQFLRVQCGTGRTFALAVPMQCRTALEANAWTYGMTPEEYRPEVRT